jgi:hypothetical protein
MRKVILERYLPDLPLEIAGICVEATMTLIGTAQRILVLVQYLPSKRGLLLLSMTLFSMASSIMDAISPQLSKKLLGGTHEAFV